MLRLIDRVVEGAAVLIFAASSLMICLNVLNRYLVLGAMRKLAAAQVWFDPIYDVIREAVGAVCVTADEVPGYLLVWVAFLGAYCSMRREGQISFDMLIDRLSLGAKKFVIATNTVLISGFLVVLFWQSVRMIETSGRTEIDTADIAQGWFMLILPLSAVLLLLALLAKLRETVLSGETSGGAHSQ